MIAVDHEIAIARALVEDVNGDPWVVLTATYSELASVCGIDASWIGNDGSRTRFPAKLAMRAFRPLRGATADEHGVWFSATVIVQQDGSYEFAYNYTDPVEWEEGVLDESYIADLARHPRPWGEVPEWHPVKRDYTEESWAAALAKGIK